VASGKRNVWRALLSEPLGVMGGIIVLAFVLMALFAPWLAPYDPLKIDVMHKFSAPSLAHWAGTDQLGRDLLSRIIYGARTLILVIILVSIPGYARFIRAQTLSLVRSDFIMAEQAMNASNARIILVHLLPNVAGQLLVVLSMDIPVVIMLEAGLSYLSLGVKPPTPSWGNILYDGYVSLRQSPGMVIIAGIPLILATLGFTFLGEALRDALDPRLQLRTLR